MNKNQQEVKLLPERTVDMEKLKGQIATLCEAEVIGRTRWEASRTLIQDIFFILDPTRLVTNGQELRYNEYIISSKLLDMNHYQDRRNLNQLIDKRDSDMVYAFADIIDFDIVLIAEVLRTALNSRQYNFIPLNLLIVLAGCHFEVPAVLRYKYRDMWGKKRTLNVQEPLEHTLLNGRELVYQNLPADQRKLLPFSNQRQKDEKRLEYEKRQERLNNREAHKLPENPNPE